MTERCARCGNELPKFDVLEHGRGEPVTTLTGSCSCDVDDTVEIAIHPEVVDRMNEIAPGVLGYVVDDLDTGDVWIPLLYARNEGNGDVGRFLSALPHDFGVVVPNVISSRLAGMLSRRGFRHTTLEVDGEDVDAWVRGLRLRNS